MYNLKSLKFKRGTKFDVAYKDTLMKHWDYEKNTKKPSEVSCATDTLKVWMKCDNGHSFDVTPSNLKIDRWCPYCSGKRVCIENSFGYNNPDKVKFWSEENDRTPYCITKGSDYIAYFKCECGYSFKASAKDVNVGKWCANCAKRPVIKNSDIDKKLESRTIYRIGDYINARTKIAFLCKKCRQYFEAIPDNVINKMSDCPNCRMSKGEEKVAEYLIKIDIKYKREVTFSDLIGINGGRLRFDFYLTHNNEDFVIEYDGIFHYENCYSEKTLKDTIQNDKIKDEYCLQKNIKMIRIPYWEFENIEEMLDKVFMSNIKECNNMPIPSQAIEGCYSR